jgi:hypothetical protein
MLVVLAVAPGRAQAFWLLNFQTAPPLPPGAVGFIGGTGGQLTLVGTPLATSYTPFLAHAGIRVGIASWLDAGYRLTTVPLPYSNAGGPGLGAQMDLKFRLTPARLSWQAAVIVDAAYAYLLNTDRSLQAWSPGADLVVSHSLGTRYAIAFNARYVFTAIPSADGGSGRNFVHAFGPTVGLRIALSDTVSLQPEIGAFRFMGQIAGVENDGWGIQYGLVLGARVR